MLGVGERAQDAGEVLAAQQHGGELGRRVIESNTISAMIQDDAGALPLVARFIHGRP